jgi:hypothetical protein
MLSIFTDYQPAYTDFSDRLLVTTTLRQAQGVRGRILSLSKDTANCPGIYALVY